MYIEILYFMQNRMFTDTSELWKDTQATDLYTLSVELGTIISGCFLWFVLY